MTSIKTSNSTPFIGTKNPLVSGIVVSSTTIRLTSGPLIIHGRFSSPLLVYPSGSVRDIASLFYITNALPQKPCLLSCKLDLFPDESLWPISKLRSFSDRTFAHLANSPNKVRVVCEYPNKLFNCLLHRRLLV